MVQVTILKVKVHASNFRLFVHSLPIDVGVVLLFLFFFWKEENKVLSLSPDFDNKKNFQDLSFVRKSLSKAHWKIKSKLAKGYLLTNVMCYSLSRKRMKIIPHFKTMKGWGRILQRPCSIVLNHLLNYFDFPPLRFRAI